MELGNEPLVFGSRGTRTAASVSANYDGGIIVRRWAATWIDFLVLLAIFMIPDAVLGNETYQSTIAVWLTLAALYFPVMESAFGKTLGKFALFIRVVGQDGRKPTVWQVVLRTLLRLIEVNPFLAGGIPAGLAAYFSKHRQRLGDMLAKTYVILDADARTLNGTPGH